MTRSVTAFLLLAACVIGPAALADNPTADAPGLNTLTLAKNFNINGESRMITPALVSQYVKDAAACRALHAVEGATIGRLPLKIGYAPDPKDPTQCLVTMTLGGQPIPDQGANQEVGWGQDQTSGQLNANAIGLYAIGEAPYALAIVDVDEVTLADHNGDLTMSLYVVRDGKPLEVFVADSRNSLSADVVHNKLTLSNVERTHGNECEACTIAETMSFNIDPKAGRVHWHAPDARATESVQYWLKEADPQFRAKEEADAQAGLTALEKQTVQSTEVAQPAEPQTPPPTPISDTTVDGVKFSEFQTGWLIGAPADGGGTMCIPYVTFTATNMTSNDIDEASFYADYLNPSQQTTFGQGTVYWNQLINIPPLPSGYHRKVSIQGTVGIMYGPGTCSSLPNIDFNLRFQASPNASTDLVVHGSVDPNSSTFYVPGAPGNPASVSQ